MASDSVNSAAVTNHVLLCLVGRAERDPAVARAAELCRASGARLSVIVPVPDVAASAGCCGIQSDHWGTLLDEDTADGARGVAAELADLGCRPEDLEIEVGPSVSEAIAAATARLGCDRVVVSRRPRAWSGWGLSRRQLAALDRAGVPLEQANLRASR